MHVEYSTLVVCVYVLRYVVVPSPDPSSTSCFQVPTVKLLRSRSKASCVRARARIYYACMR
jgi:hypothetical protein